jgi:hypothetical protein
MEVDVSYTGNIHCMRNGALSPVAWSIFRPQRRRPVGGAGGVPPAVPEASRPKSHELGIHPLVGMAANDAAVERQLGSTVRTSRATRKN